MSLPEVGRRGAARGTPVDPPDWWRLVAKGSADLLLVTYDGGSRWLSEEPAAPEDAPLEPIHPDDLPALEAAIEQCRHGSVVSSRVRVRQADDSYRWFGARSAPLAEDSGHLLGGLTSFRDMQADTDAERRLAQDEWNYRQLAENSTEVAFRGSPEGITDWVSPSLTDALGWAPEDLLGRHFTEIVHPDDVAAAGDYVDELRRGNPLRYEARFLTKGGDPRWMSVVVRPLLDADGNVTGNVGSAVDITAEVDARRRAQDSEAKYRLLAENSSDFVFRSRPGGVIEWMSPQMVEVLGWRPEDLIGTNFAELLHPDDAPKAKEVVAALAAGRRISYEARFRTKGGDYRWSAVVVRPIVDADGRYVANVGSGRDITTEIQTRQRAQDSQQRYRLLAENASDIVVQLDPLDTITWTSESVTGVLGWEPQEFAERVRELLHPDDYETASRTYADALSGIRATVSLRLATRAGRYRWLAMTVRPVPTPEGVQRVITLRDIHEEMTIRGDLEHALGHDPRTGLANRETMLARLENLLAASPRKGPARVGVLSVSVDALSDVTGALGHTAGDLLLSTVATRIVSAVGDSERIGRGSGNEFIVLSDALGSRADAAVMAASIRRDVRGPVAIHGQSVTPTVSVGITSGAAGDDPERLLREANLAMRQAKRHGRDHEEFADPEVAAEARNRLELEASIRDGLARGEFVPWFQPIVRAGVDELVGYEALVRWLRDGSITTPDVFLPIAEATDLITEIDQQVLTHSVDTLSELPGTLTVAVNVSAASLRRPEYASHVMSRLEATGADPNRLHLEVTETALLSVTPVVQDALSVLAEAGVRWYVDDFGTGYSSISHLRDLPISGLKLDRSFTAELPTATRTRQLAKALAALATALDLDTVAEGVETRRQAEILVKQGWGHLQGWLYGRPAPLDD